MAKAELRIEKLDAELTALRQLPVHLRQEASNIVQGATQGAYGTIWGKYPDVTGRLRGGLRISGSQGATGVVYRLRSRAPHARLYEYGTKFRETKTGADRGRMRPMNIFVPEVIRQRRAMYLQLASLLTRHGLKVSGSADVAA